MVGGKRGFQMAGESVDMLICQGAVKRHADQATFMWQFLRLDIVMWTHLGCQCTNTSSSLAIQYSMGRVKFSTRPLPKAMGEREWTCKCVNETTLKRNPLSKGDMCRTVSWHICTNACIAPQPEKSLTCMHECSLNQYHAAVLHLGTCACMQATLCTHWPDFACTHVCRFTSHKKVALHMAICGRSHTA